MVFENIFLLKINPFLAILLISFVITLLTTLVYKFTTDQKKLKRIREEMKESQKKARELAKTNPEKALALQQKMMASNMDVMKSSFKSSLYTIIPLLFIFAWLNTHMAFYEIQPGQEFTVTGEFAEGHAPYASINVIPELTILGNTTQEIVDNKAVFRMKGDEGSYTARITYNNEQYEQKIIISTERRYEQPIKQIERSKLMKIIVGNERVHPFGSLSIFGWMPGWLATYIILSILLSLGIRKVLQVY